MFVIKTWKTCDWFLTLVQQTSCCRQDTLRQYASALSFIVSTSIHMDLGRTKTGLFRDRCHKTLTAHYYQKNSACSLLTEKLCLLLVITGSREKKIINRYFKKSYIIYLSFIWLFIVTFWARLFSYYYIFLAAFITLFVCYYFKQFDYNEISTFFYILAIGID